MDTVGRSSGKSGFAENCSTKRSIAPGPVSCNQTFGELFRFAATELNSREDSEETITCCGLTTSTQWTSE